MIYQIVHYLMLAIMVLCGFSILLVAVQLFGRHTRTLMALELFCRQVIPTVTRCQTIAVLAVWFTAYQMGNVVDIVMAAVAAVAILLTVVLMFLCFGNLLLVRLLYLRFERYVLHHLCELDEHDFISIAVNYVGYISVKQGHDATNLMRMYILRLAVRLGFCAEHFPSYLRKS